MAIRKVDGGSIGTWSVGIGRRRRHRRTTAGARAYPERPIAPGGRPVSIPGSGSGASKGPGFAESVFGALVEPRRVLADVAAPRAAIACAAVPRDVPMPNFWSVVLYDNDTRCMIENPQGKTEVNSRQALVKNGDGSVRLVFSPKKPEACPRRTGSRPIRKRVSSPTSAGIRPRRPSSTAPGRWGISRR